MQKWSVEVVGVSPGTGGVMAGQPALMVLTRSTVVSICFCVIPDSVFSLLDFNMIT